MERSSIDVIEDVLGASLFSRNWTARSVAEIDELDPVYRAPVISEMQYREIQRRLREHWDAAWQFPDAQNDYLLVCPRVMTPLHQYVSLLDISLQEQLERSTRSYQIMVLPQIKLDDAVIARRALLYGNGVILRDPAELLMHRSGALVYGSDVDDWRARWQSAFCYLGLLAKLVRADCVRLHPVSTMQRALSENRSIEQARIEKEQEAELRALYRAPQWAEILRGLPFGDPEEAGIYAGWALGQFAWRNVVAPGATPWLPTKGCLTALSGLGEAFKQRLGDAQAITTARFSSKVGVDVGRLSDDDIITMRRNEALFATWRRFVAELCLEVDRLSLDNPADVATLVQAKEILWRAELDRQIGRGGVLSGLFDGNSIACGLITGGVAVASGMPAALSAASALDGGLVTPLVRLLGNLAGGRGAKSLKRAVAAHFMALEG